MRGPGSVELRAALDAALGVLEPAADADWTRPAGDLEWTCRASAAHIAHDLMAYASQLTSGGAQAYLPVDWTVRDGASVAEVLVAVRTAGRLLALVVEQAAPVARAWHWGAVDATGFAALGMNEVLVHAWDIAQGLDLGWRPPSSSSQVVVARLFPHAPPGEATDVLLWCTGRSSMPGYPRRGGWLPPRAAVE